MKAHRPNADTANNTSAIYTTPSILTSGKSKLVGSDPSCTSTSTRPEHELDLTCSNRSSVNVEKSPKTLKVNLIFDKHRI
jgi:hypothetical protein